MAVCFPLSAVLVRRFPNFFTYGFNLVCYVWMGIVFIWFCLAFVETITEIVFTLTKYVYARKTAGLVVIFLVASLGIYSTINALKFPQIKKLKVSIPALPAHLEGFTIAVLSDTHLCHLVRFGNFRRLIEELKKLNPDLVVHLGDYVETDAEYADNIHKVMQQINPKYGKFAVFGNHEFYDGMNKSKEIFDKSGFKVLRQETITLSNDLQITGIDDIHTADITEKDLKKVFTKINPEKPTLVLSHQPLHYDLIAEYKIDLVLSGHTHAGQIFPFNWFVRSRYPYIYGFVKKRNTIFYITSGTFYWGPPMRLFTKSEVPVITLKR